MKIHLILFLAILMTTVAAQAQKKRSVEHSPKVGQYAVVRLSVQPDTVGVDDSVTVKYTVYLDCVSKVERVDTKLDTLSRPRKVTMTVYGTVWSGPGPRPACAAMMKEMRLTLRLPGAGTWVIEMPKYRNQTKALRDTVVVR